jgi:AraC-like DNA-binding protein
LVEQPWPNADETAHRHFSAQLDRLLAGLPAPFVSMVASKLQRNLAHGAVSQAALARELGMSTRGLQRKLNASGCTFQSVLSEVRRSSALRLLSDRSIAVYEVALSLGYDDVRSFNRAFIRWTGQTPSAHRERSWGSSGAESPATMSEPDA